MVKPGNCQWQLQLSSYYSFFLSKRSLADKHETCTGMDPKWTKEHWPSFSDLDLHFKVTDPFLCRKPETSIHITSSFMIGFRWNFVGMDSYMTPCWWPTFRWPWPSSSGQTRNRPEIFVTGLAKSSLRRIILATWLDDHCQGPLQIEV